MYDNVMCTTRLRPRRHLSSKLNFEWVVAFLTDINTNQAATHSLHTVTQIWYYRFTLTLFQHTHTSNLDLNSLIGLCDVGYMQLWSQSMRLNQCTKYTMFPVFKTSDLYSHLCFFSVIHVPSHLLTASSSHHPAEHCVMKLLHVENIENLHLIYPSCPKEPCNLNSIHSGINWSTRVMTWLLAKHHTTGQPTMMMDVPSLSLCPEVWHGTTNPPPL